ncbi:MAG: class I SAM-dependent methyltransferase [Deltaproteobacteria bacterium]|nr:class I SAM-dependent methyltransferase [Deltaproteobacteria bacterium]
MSGGANQAARGAAPGGARLLAGLRAGKSLARVWMEERLGGLSVSGRVLDLGGGGARNHERLDLEAGSHVFTTDIRAAGRPSFVADAESALPIRDRALDAVLLLNVLEHSYHHRQLLEEVARVLRPGGVLYLYVPFLYPRHTAAYETFLVDDHFRYGPQTLRRLLAESGFAGPVDVEACGFGAFTAAASIAALGLPGRWLRLAIHAVGLGADRWIALWRGRRAGDSAALEWPMAFWVEAVR